MASRPGAMDRFGARQYESEIERLCGYIKNDSLVIWKLGCSLEEVAAARKRLAAVQPLGTYTAKLRPCDASAADNCREEGQRRARAAEANRAYLDAIGRVCG